MHRCSHEQARWAASLSKMCPELVEGLLEERVCCALSLSTMCPELIEDAPSSSKMCPELVEGLLEERGCCALSLSKGASRIQPDHSARRQDGVSLSGGR